MLRRPEPAAASSAWTAGSKKGVHENTAAVIPVRKSSGGVVFRVSAPGYSRKTIFEVSRPFGAGDSAVVFQKVCLGRRLQILQICKYSDSWFQNNTPRRIVLIFVL